MHMIMLIAALLGAPQSTAALPGYYEMDTVAMGSPAKMAMRITQTGTSYAVTFYPAQGMPLPATDVKVTGDRITFTAIPHEGVTLRFDLRVVGDDVTGTYGLGESTEKVTGKRKPDPRRDTSG